MKSLQDKPRPGRPVSKKPALRMVLDFKPKNYILFGAGLVSLALGFFSLSRGSDTLAPLLLVLGFCVLIPVAILIK